MAGETILVADDDRAIRTVVTHALTRQGYEVRATGNAATLWRWVSEGEGNLVVTDVVMPDGNGLDLIPQIRKIRPDLRVIAMSARNTLLTAVKATERGAFEYLPKPFDLTVLVDTVGRALKSQVSDPGDIAPNDSEEEPMPLIGRSAAMQDVYRVIARLTGTDLSVLISGESGTGKELVARALHDFSRRKNGPFVAVNMAAIPRDLIESELFGHERGAFTGATQRKSGRFELAEGGTLFLDEIGDMPLEAQTRLLRVLQESEYTMVGGRNPIKTDVRIVTATHRDLRQLVSQGLFREDLYYRLNVVPIRLPPLRERREDVPDLVRHFLISAAESGLPLKTLTEASMERLMRHRWPGNVRELENLVRRLGALYAQDRIDQEIIEAELGEAPSFTGPQEAQDPGSESLSDAVHRHLTVYFETHGDQLPAAGLHARILREIERPLIEISLNATRGNQVRTAELLGLNRNTLRKKIRDLDISVVRGGKDA
ncbi:MAG TPA: nitrogen regulation protein NR(I) [Rhodospirillaceae bacterium]|nr:nitrogen regulation protein NR(I) [Rhodospirillaceae bacterium]MAX61370.1 nitrogen regulation protein NR(I) [Rhodospirillaceae bacterium]MBB56116.1 nitrogen regulation protein NR(I) [Rhodospirillaceae bacterium]HAE01335.1 nitrogen regulation protein NR(I) [Rhodospirillaceae bacterium]|tara:strand:- start:17434 stop:18891 length:1458 start_codon:yes stop_codon:yes gene_type:complete